MEMTKGMQVCHVTFKGRKSALYLLNAIFFNACILKSQSYGTYKVTFILYVKHILIVLRGELCNAVLNTNHG